LWRLTERMLEIAVERWEAERPEGELHTPGTIRHINAMVLDQQDCAACWTMSPR
jgi:hypothetical protein